MSLSEPSAKAGPGGFHPDLNLLGALAEQTASLELRDTLIDHLAGCATCREIFRTLSRLEGEPATERQAEKQSVPIGPAPLEIARDVATRPEMPSQALMPAAAQPPGPEPAEPKATKPIVGEAAPVREGNASRLPGRQGWTRWRGWRAGFATGLAATAVLIVVVWLHRPWSPGEPPQVAMTPATAPSARPNQLPADGRNETAQAEPPRTSAPPGVGGPEEGATADARSRHKGAARSARGVEGEVNPTTGAVADRQAGETKRTSETASSQSASIASTAAETEAGSGGAIAGPPQPNRSAAEGKAPRPPAATVMQADSSKLASSMAAKPQGLASEARPLARAAAFAGAPPGPAGVADQWTIAVELQDGRPIGRLQRSADGGRTQQVVHVDDSANLTAVGQSGGSLWVGSEKGVLYHSEDSGIHWQRVRVAAADGPSLAGAVVRITLVDPLQVVVATDAHEVWTTTDGGRTWKRGD